ncbi:hypothetical protein [Kocuria sp. NPDC057446]|uniref:hypothetical protein n=1 Tax=Kocuria sp. NPDC057446 TaxID=3346137 RepID=UPI0036AC35CA
MTSQLAPSLSRTTAAPPAPGTFLAPNDPFPPSLAELELTELQVLHSRVCRQLEQEYLADPDGPHPVTQDRCQDVVAELDTRQQFLAAPVRLAEVPAGNAPDVAAASSEGPRPAPALEPVPAQAPSARHRAGGMGNVLLGLGEVRPGDRVEVWQRGVLHCRGTVQEACPALGVAWLLEAGDGYRRMVHAHDSELRRVLPSGG